MNPSFTRESVRPNTRLFREAAVRDIKMRRPGSSVVMSRRPWSKPMPFFEGFPFHFRSNPARLTNFESE
jgi:hypothetical protein